MKTPDFKLFFIVMTIISLIGIYLILENSTLIDLFTDMDLLVLKIRETGILGPLLVIGLMALAIVFNPLPSAPIALAAGALYGHIYGTIYIVVGAEIGAIVAFLIARIVGYDIARKYLDEKWSPRLLGSQNALTAAVFISRLLPFLSFDLVSYAAGLTPILFWRFALATLLGLVPVSFLLAHYGGEIIHADSQSKMITLLVVVLITALPLLLYRLRGRKHNKDRVKSGEQH
jgi:uncharacterized membrane protein YdjX (TVP38/TMEM64 family)